ncbi:hypothetical protein HanRHA438_Chr17g0805341 [Helianthus annuus]|nr:hypothetical protein HanHA89_Chr17g0700081 [Helianthus annuus]KAJ0631865.1 hypothetical protein HanLR1_Chr17g0658711 [Helianthus annuus]KAJ0825631.1 hypothetical protein HanRHA438_Chr17g0805341 [Helianthus annuus]
MGANSSLLTPDSSDDSTHPSKLTLGDIPESCVALVLSYLDPPGSIAAARREQVAVMQVQRKMKIAHYGRSKSYSFDRNCVTSAIVVQQKICSFITPNSGRIRQEQHRNDVASLLLITNPRKLGKYEIYSPLTRSVRFDDGNKEFWLDKRTYVCQFLARR